MTNNELERIAKELNWERNIVGQWVTPDEDLVEFADRIEQHLIQSGYRKCAEGQRTTQYCGTPNLALHWEGCDDSRRHYPVVLGNKALGMDGAD